MNDPIPLARQIPSLRPLAHLGTPDASVSPSSFNPHWDRQPISLDFDGVLHEFSQGYVRPEIYDPPMPGAHDALKRLLGVYALHILTARNATQVIEWCNKSFPDIPFELIPEGTPDWQKEGVVGVTNVKLPAISYIGRYMVRFTSWDDLLAPEESHKEKALRLKIEGRLPRLTDAEWGYIGGLIDGEGSFAPGINGKGRAYLRLIITNQHIEELEWIQSKLKGSVHTKKQRNEQHFPVSWWTRDGRGIMKAVRHMLDMGVIRMKKHQAELACRYWGSLRYNGRRLKDIQAIEQAQYLEAIRSMNYGGRAFIHPVMIDDRALRFTNWQDICKYFL